jgi:hypothetical protein
MLDGGTGQFLLSSVVAVFPLSLSFYRNLVKIISKEIFAWWLIAHDLAGSGQPLT